MAAKVPLMLFATVRKLQIARANDAREGGQRQF